MRCARFCVSGTNYHICIRCVYIRQLHVIVSPKLFSKKFEKDAQCLNKSKTKIVPTEFYFTNISLNSYFLALGPSNIDFPPQFTPEIDIRSFFQFPVPPCASLPNTGSRNPRITSRIGWRICYRVFSYQRLHALPIPKPVDGHAPCHDRLSGHAFRPFCTSRTTRTFRTQIPCQAKEP